MFERFDDNARATMTQANQQARRFDHDYISTEHIMLGMIEVGQGTGLEVLKNLNVEPRRVRDGIEDIVRPDPEDSSKSTESSSQTPPATKVIEYAMEEARSFDHDYVGTEHLLLGLMRADEGVAAQVLKDHRLTLEAVRNEVLRVLESEDS